MPHDSSKAPRTHETDHFGAGSILLQRKSHQTTPQWTLHPAVSGQCQTTQSLEAKLGENRVAIKSIHRMTVDTFPIHTASPKEQPNQRTNFQRTLKKFTAPNQSFQHLPQQISTKKSSRSTRLPLSMIPLGAPTKLHPSAACSTPGGFRRLVRPAICCDLCGNLW